MTRPLSSLPPASWTLALVALFAAFPLAIIAVFWVDAPFWDQWFFLPLYDQLQSGDWSFADFWAQRGNHRMLFPMMLLGGLAVLTEWRMIWEPIVNYALGLATFGLLALLVGRVARRVPALPGRLVVLVWAPLFFSISQWENWLVGWQTTYFIANLAFVACLLLLTATRRRPLAFVAAMLAAFVSTFSFANGLLAWFCGAFLICVDPSWGWKKRGSRLALALWCAAAVVAVRLFFLDYKSIPGMPSPLRWTLENPLAVVRFALAFLGNPVAYYAYQKSLAPTLAAVFGIALSGLALWRLWRRRGAAGLAPLAPIFALGLYGLGGAAMTAMTRAYLGPHAGDATRYITISSFFWYMLAALLAVETFDAREVASDAAEFPAVRARVAPARRRLCFGIALAALVGATLLRMPPALSQLRWWSDRLERGRAAIEPFGPPEALGALFPEKDLEELRVYRDLMEKHKVGVFRKDN
jgi:hypothetical protein